MKKLFLTLALVAGALPAFADLGWTYKDCVRHYGKPYSHTFRYGFTMYHFFAHGVDITTAFDDGKVVSMNFFALQKDLPFKTAMKLIANNAPGLQWSEGTEVGEHMAWNGYYNGELAAYAIASVYQSKAGPGVKIQVTLEAYSERLDAIDGGDVADQLQ
jgi:hypothetical protein